MQAAVQTLFGAPEVLQMRDVEAPVAGEGELLVRVHASPVTQGDRRLRAADFPGISWLPGRLMFGLFRPKNRTPGTMFAGRVEAIGEGVSRFAVGDDVFGSTGHSAQAELLVVSADSPVAHMPDNFDYEEAAAVPYGAVTALLLLREVGRIQAGQRVLILGAAGGVGRFAVQLAKHLGAEVTGVCSRRSFELVRDLGAAHLIDYATEDFTGNGEQYDIVFDTGDVSGFSAARGSLTSTGRYLSLHLSLRILVQMLTTSVLRGPRALIGFAFGTQEHLNEVRDLMQQGVLRPVIAARVPLGRIADAHRLLEAGQTDGAVIVTVERAKLRQAGSPARQLAAAV